MVTELLNTAAVQKLRGIIKGRYGKGLTLKYLVDASAIDFKAATPQVHKGDLQIPIIVQENFLGLATVPEVYDLDATTMAPLVDLVKMVLEPTLHKWYLETKPQVETQLIHLSSVTEEEASHNLPVSSVAKGAFLYSMNPYSIPRWALTIHDSLNRWAFLHFSDLGKEVKTRIELQALGAVTLLIDDLHLISPEQERIIADFLETSDPENEPLILIGATMPLSEVKNRRSLDPRIIEILAPYEIEVDRMPRQSRQVEEALRLLLDSEAVQMIT